MKKLLINDPDVDAVFIVSPGFAHVEALLEAIQLANVFSAKNHFAQQLKIA